MDTFISAHTFLGFILLILAVFAARSPQKKKSWWQSFMVRAFFITVLLMGISGIVIGVYRHPYSPSIFQVVTLVGVVFATIGLLAEMGRLDGFRGKSNHYWYINGLGGGLIATVSASLFFLALTYARDFYQANIIWLAILFIGLPVLLGREFIKRRLL